LADEEYGTDEQVCPGPQGLLVVNLQHVFFLQDSVAKMFGEGAPESNILFGKSLSDTIWDLQQWLRALERKEFILHGLRCVDEAGEQYFVAYDNRRLYCMSACLRATGGRFPKQVIVREIEPSQSSQESEPS
jgi:hypothetical protein